MFEVVRQIGMDVNTLKITYRVISRHRKESAAQKAFEKIGRREVPGLWPHPITPSDVVSTGLSIRKV